MTMQVRITIERWSWVPGARFWWQARLSNEEIDGFAHTERRARRKAERAARRLADKRVACYSVNFPDAR
ncbi:hypothetical protein [Streptomyces sp. ECR3.8]|uniref:hypothetical protein n=1 Tax=Streptomyces sp. ECR3.8 TaxID=3461009 RepID=UPI004042DE58